MFGHGEILSTRSLRSAHDEMQVIQSMTNGVMTARDIQRGTVLQYHHVRRVLVLLEEAGIAERVPDSYSWRLVELLE
jgi:DNA-binding IclR family transcriptional regulator